MTPRKAFDRAAIWTLVPAVGGLVASIVAALLYTVVSPPPKDKPPTSASGAEIKAVQERIDRLQAQIDALAQPGPAAGAQLNALAEQLKTLGAKHDAVESAIIKDPVQTLQVPLLSQDLANTKANTEDSLAALRREVDRQYDVTMRILLTFILGITGLVVSQVLAIRRTKMTDEGSIQTKQADSGS